MKARDLAPLFAAALLCPAALGVSAAEPAGGTDPASARKPQAHIEITPATAATAGQQDDGRAAPAKASEAPAPAVRVGPAAGAARAASEGASRSDGDVLEFAGTPASEVLTFISEYAGVNIVTDPDCAEKLKTRVSFQARGMTCRQVLDWVVRLSGTAWMLTDGAIYVTSRDKLPREENPVELARRIIAESPEFDREPAQFEPAPEMGLPERK